MTSYSPPQPASPSAEGGATPPLWAPHYGATLAVAVRRFWKKYATFSGRASRSEYWWWTLIAAIVTAVLYIAMIVGGITTGMMANGNTEPGPAFFAIAPVFLLWFLATVVPTLALTWRRLHDVNLSGGFFFLSLIPSLGSLAVLVLTILPSVPAGARFDQRV